MYARSDSIVYVSMELFTTRLDYRCAVAFSFFIGDQLLNQQKFFEYIYIFFISFNN